MNTPYENLEATRMRSKPLVALMAVYDAILKVCNVLVGLLLATELALICFNVSARTFFDVSWGWMDETSQYTLLWLVATGSVVLFDRHGLFFTEIALLYIRSERVRKTLFIVNMLILMLFFAIVCKTGIDYVRVTWTFEMDYSDMRKFWFYAAMPVWGGLMCIVALKKLAFMEQPDINEIDTES